MADFTVEKKHQVLLRSVPTDEHSKFNCIPNQLKEPSTHSYNRELVSPMIT